MIDPAALRNKRRLFKQRNREEWGKRRISQVGYPMPAREMSLEEIAWYFSGDRIECLLCGRWMVKLFVHLIRIHGVSPDRYRETYGIAYGRALMSDDCVTRASAAVSPEQRQRLSAMSAKARLKAAQAIRATRPRMSAQKRQRSSKHFLDLMQKTQCTPDSDFEAIVDRIVSGVKAKDAITPMSKSTFYEWLNHHPETAQRLRDGIDALPFQVQAQMQQLGPRFEVEATALHLSGCSDFEVARRLGVTAMSVNKITKRLRAKGSVSV